jgi:hypothetical protein
MSTHPTTPLNRELREAIAVATRRAASGAGASLATRAAVIEFLELHVLDRLEHLGERARLPADLAALGARARALHRRLEVANQRFLSALRDQVRSGRLTPGGLRRVLARQAGPPTDRPGFDAMDLLVSGLLEAGPLAEERVAREPEMVGYQPTPARAILALLERAEIGPADLLSDLGSGLGWVVILVALLSGARATGIELEPAYVEYATRCARGLKVPGVRFVMADARRAPLANGTVYFMFTPFRGALLRRVLERLRAEARVRPIRVCTYGPCTAEVAGARWLEPGEGGPGGEHEVAVFRSLPPRGGARRRAG